VQTFLEVNKTKAIRLDFNFNLKRYSKYKVLAEL